MDEIKALYEEIDQKIWKGKNLSLPSCETIDYSTSVTEAIAACFTSRSLVSSSVNCDLISHFNREQDCMDNVSRPFSPDIIVYCKSKYLFLDSDVKPDEVKELIEQFETKHGYYPKVILKEGGGLTVVEANEKSLKIVQDTYLNMMKISYLSEHFGGPHFMTPDQISFIDSWEVEHYRRKVAKG